MARSWHLAIVDLLDIGYEFLHMRYLRLHPIPFEDPGADARFGRQAFQNFELLLRSGDVEPLVETKLDGLFQRVDHVLAGEEKNDDVRVRCLRLDQV
jgi:hypothetical protein